MRKWAICYTTFLFLFLTAHTIVFLQMVYGPNNDGGGGGEDGRVGNSNITQGEIPECKEESETAREKCSV